MNEDKALQGAVRHKDDGWVFHEVMIWLDGSCREVSLGDLAEEFLSVVGEIFRLRICALQLVDIWTCNTAASCRISREERGFRELMYVRESAVNWTDHRDLVIDTGRLPCTSGQPDES